MTLENLIFIGIANKFVTFIKKNLSQDVSSKTNM